MSFEKTVAFISLAILFAYVVSSMNFLSLRPTMPPLDSELEEFVNMNDDKMKLKIDLLKKSLVVNIDPNRYDEFKNNGLDISNFKFSKKPLWNKNYFSFNTEQLTGYPISRIQPVHNSSSSFTIIVQSTVTEANKQSNAILDLKSEYVLDKYCNENEPNTIMLKGNQGTSLSISIPNEYCNISINAVDEKYKVTQKIIPSNGINTYTFIYNLSENKKNGEISVYINDTFLQIIKTGIILLNNNEPIIVNESKNWNSNLYSLLIFNRSIEVSELKIINDILKNKLTDGSIGFDKSKSSLNYKNQKPEQKLNNNSDVKRKKLINLIKKMYKINLYQCLNKIKKDEHELDDNECITRKSMCYRTYDENLRSINTIDISKYSDLFELDLDKILEDEINKYKKSAPFMFIENGEYFVYIYRDSELAKKHGHHGKRSYGKDEKYAKKIYEKNYPEYGKPKIINVDKSRNRNRNVNSNSCPFVINDKNPCQQNYCKSVNWNTRHPEKHGMSNRCMKKIEDYCETYNEYDDACMCWKPENSDLDYCREIKSNFGYPYSGSNKRNQGNDGALIDVNVGYKTSTDIFNIEDHPDFSKYIRKDQIPCFGCDIK